jgi:hypothetical protein
MSSRTGNAAASPAASAAAAAVTARYARGVLYAAIAVVSIWHLTHDLAATVAYWDAYRFPPAVAGAWLTLAGVGLAAAVMVLRGGGRAAPLPWAGSAVLLAANAVMLAQVPPQQPLSTIGWSWGALGWFGLVVLWRRRLVELIALIGLGSLTVLPVVLLRHGAPAADLAEFGLVVCGTASLQLTLAVGVRLLDSTARRAADVATAHAEAATNQAVAVEVHAWRSRRYRALHRTAGPLLAGLADGRLDPSDLGVQRRCEVEAARLRRLIAETDDVPDPLLHELRACADLAERRGVSVDLVCVGDLPRLEVETRRALTETPIKVLAATRTHARLTIAATPEELVVGIVADADIDLSLDPGATEWTSIRQEGPTTWAESRWSTSPPTPVSAPALAPVPPAEPDPLAPSRSPSSTTTRSSSMASPAGSGTTPRAGSS